MKYLEWLRQNGCRCPGIEVTEQEAVEISKQLLDPHSAEMKEIRRIVVHHSATETGNAATFRVLHRIINEWNDIGYHFVIGNGTLSGDGEVEAGRALPFQGAHAKGANEDSIGICLVGNFNRKAPSDAQMRALQNLLKRFMKEYSIAVSDVTIHRLVAGSDTQCPGKHLCREDVVHLIEGQ